LFDRQKEKKNTVFLNQKRGIFVFVAGHNINKIFDRSINNGYVQIWKNTHKISTCFSYGTIIFIFILQYMSYLVNLWSPVIFIMFTLSFKIWIFKNNEGKGTTLCRNSNHLMLKKYHKTRDLILKIIYKTNDKCIKEQYHGNRNNKYENVTMCCVYIY